MRLIDADALIHVLVSLKEDYKKEGSFYRAKAVACLIKILQHKDISPTIEAEPVRHGRWEFYPDSAHIRCTCCKMEFDKTKITFTTKRCPNCGAKMDGGSKDA